MRMKKLTLREEHSLLSGLKRGNKEAFNRLFQAYYADLVLFGGNFVPEKEVVEDTVQNVFLRLWEEREQFAVETSLQSYLLKAVRNSCIDELRHRKIVRDYHSAAGYDTPLEEYDTENYILYSDLHARLRESLSKLPEKAREAFELNRFEGLKYTEIAERLDVSQRTVEVRIGKALELLRTYLKDFFLVLATLWEALIK